MLGSILWVFWVKSSGIDGVGTFTDFQDDLINMPILLLFRGRTSMSLTVTFVGGFCSQEIELFFGDPTRIQ